MNEDCCYFCKHYVADGYCELKGIDVDEDDRPCEEYIKPIW